MKRKKFRGVYAGLIGFWVMIAGIAVLFFYPPLADALVLLGICLVGGGFTYDMLCALRSK